MPATRETLLAALLARLQPLAVLTLRDEVLPERVPADGLIILRDDQPGEPEAPLSLLRGQCQHRAEPEVVVRAPNGRFDTPDTSQPCPDDKVNRLFTADRPNKLWVSDFTCVQTWSGTVYVAHRHGFQGKGPSHGSIMRRFLLASGMRCGSAAGSGQARGATRGRLRAVTALGEPADMEPTQILG